MCETSAHSALRTAKPSPSFRSFSLILRSKHGSGDGLECHVVKSRGEGDVGGVCHDEMSLRQGGVGGDENRCGDKNRAPDRDVKGSETAGDLWRVSDHNVEFPPSSCLGSLQHFNAAY